MDILQQPPQIKGGTRTLSGEGPEPTKDAHHVLLTPQFCALIYIFFVIPLSLEILFACMRN